jgi:hypothetical protein
VSPFPDLTATLPAPHAEDEWRVLARAASGLLLIDDARLFGLVHGGPAVDRARCLEILAMAGEHGISVTTIDAAGAAVEFAAGWNGHAEELIAGA